MMFCQTWYEGPYPVHIIILVAERILRRKGSVFYYREIFKFRDYYLRDYYISHVFPNRENREIKWE